MSSGPQDGVLAIARSLLEMAVVALFVVTFLGQPFRIPSESMEPTLKVGDFLLVDKQAYGPGGVLDRVLLPGTSVRRGDLVVFHDPVDATRDLVKRVIGLPGERLRLQGGRVFINGAELAEPYAFYSLARPNGFRDDFPDLQEADPNVDPHWWVELRRTVVNREVVVPEGHYFVMGDNRNDSEDSRYWGFVPREALVGRPLLVYFSTAGLQQREDPDHAHPQTMGEAWKAVWKSLRVLH